MKEITLAEEMSVIPSTSRMIAVPPGGIGVQTTFLLLNSPGWSVEPCTVSLGPELAWTLERSNSQRLKRNNIGLSALAGMLAVLSLAVLGLIIASVPHSVSATPSGPTTAVTLRR